MVGACACGARVEREQPAGDGWLARMVRAAPLVCAACIESAEASDAAHESARSGAVRFDRRLSASGLPRGLRDLSWDQVPRTVRPEAVEAARAWSRGDLPGLFLTGPVGVGKTYLAATAVWPRLQSEPLRWYQHGALLARLGEDFGTDGRQQAAADLTDTSTLVLDDLGKAKSSDFAAASVLTAIDQRITAGAGLLVTSNHSLDQLLARFPVGYADAIVSRLAGYCDAIRVPGQDLRLLARGAA